MHWRTRSRWVSVESVIRYALSGWPEPSIIILPRDTVYALGEDGYYGSAGLYSRLTYDRAKRVGNHLDRLLNPGRSKEWAVTVEQTDLRATTSPYRVVARRKIEDDKPITLDFGDEKVSDAECAIWQALDSLNAY